MAQRPVAAQKTSVEPSRGQRPLTWGNMGRLFGGQTADVPPEMEALDQKTKELHTLILELQKLVKRYLKSLMAHSSAVVTVANHLQEFGHLLQSHAPVLKRLADAFIACSVSENNLRERVESGFDRSTEMYLQDVVIPSKEAKRNWQKAKNDLEDAKRRVEQMKLTQHVEPSKVLVQQIQTSLLRRREQDKLEAASDSLSDTVWSRDFIFLLYLVEFIMELHDLSLAQYSKYYDLEPFFQQMKTAADEKRVRFNKRKEELDKQRNHEEEESFYSRYQPLVELLSAEDLAVVNAISMTAGGEQEEILTSVLKILDAHKKTLPIIKLAITNEVASTQNATTLFRGNSMSTKLMTAYTRMIGQKYLEIVKPLIHEMIKTPSGYEVDPAKCPKTENVVDNLARLKSLCQRFLDAICSSIQQCPIPFMEISKQLQNEVLGRFPTAGLTGVAGFLFLRFFCPAILSPEANGLTVGFTDAQVQDKSLRRGLILVSKVIQNCANNVKFGAKEQFMQEMNDFIDASLPKIQAFMTLVSAGSTASDYETLCSLEESRGLELPKLHLKIVQNLEKIANILQTNDQDAVLDELLLILGELGDVDVVVQRQKPVSRPFLAQFTNPFSSSQ